MESYGVAVLLLKMFSLPLREDGHRHNFPLVSTYQKGNYLYMPSYSRSPKIHTMTS